MREMVVKCDGCGNKSGGTPATEVWRVTILMEESEKKHVIMKKVVDLCGGCRTRTVNALRFAMEEVSA